MPIKDKSAYPPNWKAISKHIRERDGNKCVFCGVVNYAIGARDKNGQWCDMDSIHRLNFDHGVELFGEEFPKMIQIVLTVAHHPDPNPANCADSNLVSLCQRCHNRLDAPMRAIHRHETIVKKREAKVAATGQVRLFE